jgi:peroxiredoxin (alkyl hydroperoxide reductase subunit C)|tara:strand:+ start:475 stop:960 length:486 start_codon:yes stop_codon:yes gene_type:complete
MKIRVKDEIPNCEVFQLIEGHPVKKDIFEIIKGKKVVLFGLPGAYTSVCSAKHLPGYINNADQFKAKGVDNIICISVNDPFVMDAWGKNNCVGNKIIMLADPFVSFTKAIGADIDKSARGLGIRSNRYTMLIEDNKVILIQEELDTGVCEISAAESFLQLI